MGLGQDIPWARMSMAPPPLCEIERVRNERPESSQFEEEGKF